MLILAYLLQSSLNWQDARVRLKMVVPEAVGLLITVFTLPGIILTPVLGVHPRVQVGGGSEAPSDPVQTRGCRG